LATLEDATAAAPPHLVAAARSGPPGLRPVATIGGNCAPDVAGCVSLVLLSLGVTALLATPRGPTERPLASWAGGRTALVGLRWDPGGVLGGGFARARRCHDDGRPVCAVAATATPAGLRVVVGYLADHPVVLEAPTPAVARVRVAAALPPLAPADRADLARCLRRALATVG
jgi:CO/xanthine dehydrogenase FAD-binding subunit